MHKRNGNHTTDGLHDQTAESAVYTRVLMEITINSKQSMSYRDPAAFEPLVPNLLNTTFKTDTCPNQTTTTVRYAVSAILIETLYQRVS